MILKENITRHFTFFLLFELSFLGAQQVMKAFATTTLYQPYQIAIWYLFVNTCTYICGLDRFEFSFVNNILTSRLGCGLEALDDLSRLSFMQVY